MSINLYPIHRAVVAEDYLDAAKAAAEYLRSFAIAGESGVFWQKDAAEGEKPQIDFYDGSAGIILFFIQLAKYSGDTVYLKDAAAGGDYILNELEKTDYNYDIQSNFKIPSYSENTWAFYSGGFSGVAFSLIELAKATGNSEYEAAALKLTEKIAASAKPAENGGVTWTGRSGIMQDSGTILYLLYAAKHFAAPQWVDLAAEAGRAIISTGVRFGEDKVRYDGFINFIKETIGIEGVVFPNFAYGTSGMSYTLARLYEETKDPLFLEAAEKGANYLISISTDAGGGKLIPFLEPNNEDDIHYLNFCHGPAGTARLFILLSRYSENSAYKDFYLALTKGLLDSGVPEYHSAGYWNCQCQCCGTAGLLNYFIGLWLETSDTTYFDAAERSGKVILGGANYDGTKAAWYQIFTRSSPDVITSDLGYYRGSAGIGAALLQLYLALTNKFETIRLPDDPFTSAQ